MLMSALGWLVVACVGQPAVLVEYRRSGGILGLRDRLVVYEDGRVELERRGARYQFTLGSEELARLRGALERAGFGALRPEYFPSGRWADLVEFTLVYRGRTVRGVLSPEVPEGLRQVLAELDGLVERWRPQ